MKMTFFVSGSNGLLGQKVIQKLILQNSSNQYQIIGCGKGPNRLPNKGFTYLELDITNKIQLLEAFQTYKPTHVIHTAAQTNVDYCELHQSECWEANVNAVEYLVQASKLVNAHITHVSTDFIFDGLKGSLYTEEDTPNPVSYYGKSKLEAEKIMLNSGLNVAILRTILVYGVVRDMSRSNIVLWVKKSLEAGQTINVVEDQARTPTLAEDLAEACISSSLIQAKGIFNVGGPEYMNIYELACRVARFFGLKEDLINPVDSTTFTQPAKRPPRTGFIIEKAKRILNYNPHSFEEGLELVKQQLKQN